MCRSMWVNFRPKTSSDPMFDPNRTELYCLTHNMNTDAFGAHRNCLFASNCLMLYRNSENQLTLRRLRLAWSLGSSVCCYHLPPSIGIRIANGPYRSFMSVIFVLQTRFVHHRVVIDATCTNNISIYKSLDAYLAIMCYSSHILRESQKNGTSPPQDDNQNKMKNFRWTTNTHMRWIRYHHKDDLHASCSYICWSIELEANMKKLDDAQAHTREARRKKSTTSTPNCHAARAIHLFVCVEILTVVMLPFSVKVLLVFDKYFRFITRRPTGTNFFV